MSNYSDNNNSNKFTISNHNHHPHQQLGDELNPPAKTTTASASLNLFSKNFTTYMKYSDSNQTLDINMALANTNTNTNSTSLSETPLAPDAYSTPTVQLKNANSFELDQFRAEKLFNTPKETRLNDLLAAANLTLNESKPSNGLSFLKRQSNALQTNLLQFCDNNNAGIVQQQVTTNNSTTTTTPTSMVNSKPQVKKEINTIAIDQVLDKLTNSIKNDKKLASNIRFTPNEETKSSICSSSSSSASHSSSSSASSSSSSSSSSRTESNDKTNQPISLNLLNNKSKVVTNPISTSTPNTTTTTPTTPTTKLSNLSQTYPTPMSTPLDPHHAVGLSQTGSDAVAVATTPVSTQSKSQFNIENELIKYTKNLKLNSQPYTDFYKLGSHIRNGGFSEIYEGIHAKSNEKVIVKLIPKRKTKNWLMVHNKKYPAEILLHKMSNNISGVVKMLEFYEQENEWVIIMPKLYNCMDLFDYLESKQRGRLSEIEACHFFTQLVRINIDLLSQGVVHRDIKSENILVDLDSMKLILIDFGASAICRHSQSQLKTMQTLNQHFYTDFHGTRQYKPPEYITNKKYTALASTIWTLGILLYDMCNGQLPFETEQEILEYNLQIKANVSEEYKQLLFDCLKLDPAQRPSLDQVLEYSWIINNTKQFQSQQQQQQTSIQSNNSEITQSIATTSPNSLNL